MELNRLKEIDEKIGLQKQKQKKCSNEQKKNVYQLTTHLRLTNLPQTNKIINIVSTRYNK